ncbi:unnamed protein product [Ilex paraguariensis]|uniref:Uncharacterized protein n=1 Tax=Ilex paraguariensis TaxID=185542 RepID=A0ABC8TFT4_9AQUA
MYLRRAVSTLQRRLRYSSQTVTATSCGRTTNSLPNSGKTIFLSQSYSGGDTGSRRCRDAFQWILLSGQAGMLSLIEFFDS